jgi:hypothetical protein
MRAIFSPGTLVIVNGYEYFNFKIDNYLVGR